MWIDDLFENGTEMDAGYIASVLFRRIETGKELVNNYFALETLKARGFYHMMFSNEIDGYSPAPIEVVLDEQERTMADSIKDEFNLLRDDDKCNDDKYEVE